MLQVLNACKVCGILRKISERSLAKDWIPVPASLHWQASCLLRHTFLTGDSPGARYMRGGLFRPKLYTNGLSWHTISRYYPFNSETFFMNAKLNLEWIRGVWGRTNSLEREVKRQNGTASYVKLNVKN
jgi:hypothetical protein